MSNKLALNIENIKKEKDGLDVLGDIFVYAVLGERATKSDLERFKWYGIYQHEDDENLFELRVPLSLGELNLDQLKTLSFISKEYTDSSLFFSSEQKVELKGLKFSSLPNIFNLLQAEGLNTTFEAGHTVRRVLTCPVNGIDSEQLLDVSTLANKLNNTFISNKSFSNLPNKLQMAISGYKEGCELPFTPDVSFNATKDDKNKIVFSINIIGKNIGYITPSQVLITAKAIAKIFRDYGNRQNSKKSSFEHLVNKWGIKEFYELLNSSIDYKIKQLYIFDHVEIPRRPRMGINKSTIEGQSYIGCRLENLKIKSEDLETLTSLLEKYNSSKIKLTHKGNVIILDTPTTHANDFAKDLQEISFNSFL